MNLKVVHSEEFVYVDSVDFKLMQEDIDAIKAGSEMLFGKKFESITFFLKGGILLNASDDDIDEEYDEELEEDDDDIHEIEYCEIIVVNDIKDDKPKNKFFLRIQTDAGFCETHSITLDDYYKIHN